MNNKVRTCGKRTENLLNSGTFRLPQISWYSFGFWTLGSTICQLMDVQPFWMTVQTNSQKYRWKDIRAGREIVNSSILTTTTYRKSTVGTIPFSLIEPCILQGKTI